MNTTGADICAWSTLPIQTWSGSSCGGPSPTPPPSSGQHISTSTKGPEPGDENNVLFGCTATTTTMDYVMICAGTPTPISTIFPPPPSPSPSPPPPPPPPPTADCKFWDQAVMWKFGIVNVTNWVEKDGVPWTTALFKEGGIQLWLGNQVENGKGRWRRVGILRCTALHCEGC